MDAHKPETRRRLDAEYRERHKERLRADAERRRRQLKREVLQHYGDCCAICGFNDTRALQIDHVIGNGNVERHSLGGQHFAGHRFYQWLKAQDWPSGYQTLCANCNMIKHRGENYLVP